MLKKLKFLVTGNNSNGTNHNFPQQIFPNSADQFAKFSGKLWLLSKAPEPDQTYSIICCL